MTRDERRELLKKYPRLAAAAVRSPILSASIDAAAHRDDGRSVEEVLVDTLIAVEEQRAAFLKQIVDAKMREPLEVFYIPSKDPR